MPEEIREDEAHLNHILVLNATPTKDMGFKVSSKLLKVNAESLEVLKNQITKFGTVVVLHDAKQYNEDLGKANEEAKAEERRLAEEQAEKTKKANEEAKADLKAKDAKIKALEEELAKTKKATTPAKKEEQIKHIVTQLDLDNNPDLVAEGIKVGEEISFNLNATAEEIAEEKKATKKPSGKG